MMTTTNRITQRPHSTGTEACIRDTNINVWGLVAWRRLGQTDAQIVESILGLTLEDVAAAWDYYAEHRDEIDGFIRRNEESDDQMTTMTTDRITKTPGVCGGDACIRGHRIPVWALVGLRQLGADDNKILEAYPSITAPDLEAAWDYYASNREEIDRNILENEDDSAE